MVTILKSGVKGAGFSEARVKNLSLNNYFS